MSSSGRLTGGGLKAVKHDASLVGDGSNANRLKVDVQHDSSLVGSGAEGDPMMVSGSVVPADVIRGTLTSTVLPVATGAHAIADSHVKDVGTFVQIVDGFGTPFVAIEVANGNFTTNGTLYVGSTTALHGAVTIFAGGLNMSGTPLTSVPTPFANQDGANKQYVDDKTGLVQKFSYTVLGSELDLTELTITLPAARVGAAYYARGWVRHSVSGEVYEVHVDTTSQTTIDFVASLTYTAQTGDVLGFEVTDGI